MIDITIIGIDKLRDVGARARGLRQATKDTVVAETKKTGEYMVGTARSKYLSGRPGLNVGTGNLRSRITWETSESDNYIDLTLGTNVVYARIHELGGTIFPKKGLYLRFKTRDGGFVTVKSVTIPKRPYLRPSIEDNVGPFQARLVNALKELANKTL